MLRAANCSVSKALAFVLMVYLCLAARTAHAETVAVRPTSAATVSIASDLEILEDPSGQMSLSDVMGAPHGSFKPADTDRPAFGISRGAAWTRVEVDLSQDPERANRRAQFSAIHPDTVSFVLHCR